MRMSWLLICYVQMIQKKYTGLDSTSEMMSHLVKADLTPALSKLVSI
jgi:hypothetical protein